MYAHGRYSYKISPLFSSKLRMIQGDTKKTGTFEKPNKNWRNPRKKIDRN
jgi:hypothetical protein